MVCVEAGRAVEEVRNIDIRPDVTEARTPFSSTLSSASEARMSVSDTAVSMTATWKLSCTPAGAIRSHLQMNIRAPESLRAIFHVFVNST